MYEIVNCLFALGKGGEIAESFSKFFSEIPLGSKKGDCFVKFKTSEQYLYSHEFVTEIAENKFTFLLAKNLKINLATRCM